MRARLYSSCASSTWSLPSALWAWSAKMSRITAVRSITGTPSASSRLRSWRGASSSSQATTLASGALDLVLELVELAAAEVAVGIGLGSLLDHPALGCDAGGAQELSHLGQLAVLAGRAGEHADRDRALTGARVPHPASTVPFRDRAWFPFDSGLTGQV